MLATVIRGPSCWKLASLSSKGFSVLITGSVLETEQSIQTSCWDGCQVLAAEYDAGSQHRAILEANTLDGRPT